MSNLQEILNLNASGDTYFYTEVSSRLKDENGENIKFKIKPLLFEDLTRLKKKASYIDKNGQTIIDEDRLNLLCVIESTLEPSFKDSKSIKEFNIVTPEQYINKVLLAGEIERLIKEIFKISGFVYDVEELVCDIKN